MRILLVHSDFIEFEPKEKALKWAEEVKKGKKRVEECLVVFSAVEERDEPDAESVAKLCADEIVKVAEEVKCKNIVLYPYVHLTSLPSEPSVGKRVLDSVAKLLEKKDYLVTQAPFGFYKSFTISCKGHPLSELSREITALPGIAKKEEEISGALKAEEQVKSEWFILEDGKLTPADKFDFKKHSNLEKFYRYEFSKARSVTVEPPHIKLMKSLQLVDYEPGSDPGNMRWYPKGRLMKSLLEMWVTGKVLKYGASEVETPIMYDYEHPALKSYLHRFPARQYVVKSAKKDFFLRFSACFGQFLSVANATISYKELPFKIYELTRYSFRLEKAGELVGLRRLRAFTMPDMHTLCFDMVEAKNEFKNQFKLCVETLRDLGFGTEDYEMALRFTKDFFETNKEFLFSFEKLLKKPILIEIWNRRYAYFDPKFEFNFVDNLDKAAALSTVQIDHENAKTFNITYTDKDNAKKNPLILHCSPSGAIERCIYAMLEKAAMESKKGKNPIFPLWLSPVQIRLCPVNDSFIDYCKELLEKFEKENIRVDLDDRTESVQKKIRDSEVDWVPMAIVVGEKEKKSGKLAVRFRVDEKIKQMKLDEIVDYLKKEIEGYPFKSLPMSKLLSRRVSFK